MDNPGHLTFPSGRVPDGQGVPKPDSYAPPRRGGVVTTITVCTVIVFALMGLGIAGVWP